MPNFDGTGPEGRGPLTGRKRGRCIDKDKESTENNSIERDEIVYGPRLGRRLQKSNKLGGKRKRGRGFGRRFGRGFGYGRRFDDYFSKGLNKDDEE